MPIIHPIIDVVQPNSRVDLFQRPPDDRRSVTRSPVQKIAIMDGRREKTTTALNKGREYMTMSDVVDMLRNLDLPSGLALVRDDSGDDVPCYKIVQLPDDMKSCGIAPPLLRPRPSHPDFEWNLGIHKEFEGVMGWRVLGGLPELSNGYAPATSPKMTTLCIRHRLFCHDCIWITGSCATNPVSVADVVEALWIAFRDDGRVPKLPNNVDFKFASLEPCGPDELELVLEPIHRHSMCVPDRSSGEWHLGNKQERMEWRSSSFTTKSYGRSQPQIRYRSKESSLGDYQDNEWDEDRRRFQPVQPRSPEARFFRRRQHGAGSY